MRLASPRIVGYEEDQGGETSIGGRATAGISRAAELEQHVRFERKDVEHTRPGSETLPPHEEVRLLGWYQAMAASW